MTLFVQIAFNQYFTSFSQKGFCDFIKPSKILLQEFPLKAGAICSVVIRTAFKLICFLVFIRSTLFILKLYNIKLFIFCLYNNQLYLKTNFLTKHLSQFPFKQTRPVKTFLNSSPQLVINRIRRTQQTTCRFQKNKYLIDRTGSKTGFVPFCLPCK